MASVMYSGGFGGVGGASGTTTTLTGSALPANAIITGVSYTLGISAGGFSTSNSWVLDYIAVGDNAEGSPYSYGSSATMYDDEHTFSGSMVFSAADVSKFSEDTITVYAKARTTHSSSSFLHGVSVVVDYELPGKCTAPTTVSVSSANAAPGASVTLSWSGAKAGANNAIRAYGVYRSSSPAGTYTGLTTVTTTATSGSVTVTAPTTPGASYYYKVKTFSKLSGYDSDQSSAYATLTCKVTACTAPTTVKVTTSTVDAGTTTTLSWSGAKAGTNNAIKGYEVYRSGFSDGTYTLLTTVNATATSGSVTVTASDTMGKSYFYKVKTLGTLDGYDSAQSTAYASLTARTYTACTAPTKVQVNATNVSPSASVTLSWSGAAAGTNNAIASYKVYRSGYSDGTYVLLTTVSSTATADSVTVTAPATSGSSYYYKVQTVGVKSGYDSAQSTVYATLTCRVTACTAPTTVTVSTGSVPPGEQVTLKWSGAVAGTNNAITGYKIYRSGYADGTYTLFTTVSSTATSGSMTVSAPTANGSGYYYKVQTLGTLDGYNSAQSTVYASLVCSFSSVGAPTKVSVAATNVAPGAEVELSWSGAKAGTNNAIKGYEVYLSGFVDGTYTLLTTVTTSAASGSVTVTASTKNNASYYYRVKTLGTTSGTDSGQSTAYATLTCTYSAPSAPTKVTIRGTTSYYTVPGDSVVLSWSGAVDGANNPITGYTIYRNGYSYLTVKNKAVSMYSLEAPPLSGMSYTYTVVALGTHSDSAQSAACTVYAYTDPGAPTEITVSNAVPAAGTRVTLSWSGASVGGFNDIVGYKVYRSASEGGELVQVAAVDSTDTSASCYVTAPSMAGLYYYYRVETVGSYSSSGVSDESVALGAHGASDDDTGEVEIIVPPPVKRERRGFVLGEYSTAAKGWTLTGWTFPAPETQTNFVEVPGRSAGQLDLSTSLTNGDPRYNGRDLTVSLECSEGDRLERDALISELVNRLHGQRVDIVFPDDTTRYATGRLSVDKLYSDPAHAAVEITAICDPWLYSKKETHLSLMVIEEPITTVLHNNGRRQVVPDVEVTGYNSTVHLSCGGHEWTLGVGRHKLPDLVLPHGNTELTYWGLGTIHFVYREAIL